MMVKCEFCGRENEDSRTKNVGGYTILECCTDCEVEILKDTCPDCGSHNIEIVDGPIMQCKANHSGECQDCFTVWTID